MTTGLFALVGTITAGFLTDHLGIVTVLNLQAVGYVLGGLLILTLLPREKNTSSSEEKRELAAHAPAQSEG